MASRPKKQLELSTVDRKAMCHMVLAMCEDGVPLRGAYANIAPPFSVAPQTVTRLWKLFRNKIDATRADHDNDTDEFAYLLDKSKGLPEDFFASGATKRRKDKFIHDRDELKAAALELPFSKRRKLRHLASNLKMPLSTVHKFIKQHKVFKRHANPLKPSLAVSNKHDRLLHALEKTQQQPHQLNTRNQQQFVSKFVGMFNEMHVDEKWFYLCRDNESYILVSDEEDPPERHVKHKSHVTKVMFLCAMARPRCIHNRHWDGKIGIWPVGHCRAATRDSINRPAGTRLFESESIDMDKHRSMLIGDALPAILTEFPAAKCNRFEHIIIQQDGAPTHIHPRDHEWMETLTDMGLEDKIKLIAQPANSPDLNINDLGFFNALQASYYCYCPSNEMELITMATECFEEHPRNKINRIWLTHQSALNETIKHAGDNHYKIPHMGKDKLEREGRLPTALEVTPEATCYLEA